MKALSVMILAGVVVLTGLQPAVHAGHECRGKSPEGTRCDESRVSVRYISETGRFSGDVDSHMRFCVRNRVVAVRQVRRGEDKTIAASRTNENGWWKVEVAMPHGKYYAVGRHKGRSSPPDSVDICYRSKSKTIEVN